MLINQFKDQLKLCKQSFIYTGNGINLIVHKNSTDHNHWILKSENQNVVMHVILKKTKDSLTIFEAHMLFMIFAMKKKPTDYADWHTCESGIEFIKNIDKIFVMQPLKVIYSNICDEKDYSRIGV